MKTLELSPEVVLPCGTITGEGPVWDRRTGLLHFIDCKHPAIWTFNPQTGDNERLRLSERIGFVSLTEDPKVMVAGLEAGLVKISLESGESTLLVDPEAEAPQTRINDGVADLDGGLIFGSMDNLEYRPTGSFYRYHPEDGLTCFDSGFVVSNGPFPSIDGEFVYYVDSVGFKIKRVRRQGKAIGEPEVFFDWPEDWGYPDGLTGDAEGGFWIAHWNGHGVTRIDASGSPSHYFAMPTEHITKVWFGGPDLATMYITTASIDQNIVKDPLAGHLFALDCGFRGIPANFAKV